MKRTLTLADIKALIALEVSKATAGLGVQIDYLETKVEELKETNMEYLDRIIDLERKVEELENTLEDKVDELEDRLDGIPDQYDVDRLDERVEELENWSESVPTTRDIEEEVEMKVNDHFNDLDLTDLVADIVSEHLTFNWQ